MSITPAINTVGFELLAMVAFQFSGAGLVESRARAFDRLRPDPAHRRAPAKRLSRSRRPVSCRDPGRRSDGTSTSPFRSLSTDTAGPPPVLVGGRDPSDWDHFTSEAGFAFPDAVCSLFDRSGRKYIRFVTTTRMESTVAPANNPIRIQLTGSGTLPTNTLASTNRSILLTA